MRRRSLLPLLSTLLVAGLPPAVAQYDYDGDDGARRGGYDDTYANAVDEDGAARYFGRVRTVQGAPQLERADGGSEGLRVNLPVFARDRIVTGGGERAEIQLPLG